MDSKEFINAVSPWMLTHDATSVSENWIPFDSVIGVTCYPDSEAARRGQKKFNYYLRTSFMIGRGINGVDNLLEVTQDVYTAVKRRLLPLNTTKKKR